MEVAYRVDVSDYWQRGDQPFYVAIHEMKASGQTVGGEPLYELHGGRLYQPAQYADAVPSMAAALGRASAELFERADKLREQAEEYRRRSWEQSEIEREEAAA